MNEIIADFKTTTCDSMDERGELKSTENTSEMTLEIYSDEIKRAKAPDNSVWTYLGVLFVPKECKDYHLRMLNNLRCIQHQDWKTNACPHNCGYHDKNNTVIHYNMTFGDYHVIDRLD